jgi:para-nitrobenzyl esterase
MIARRTLLGAGLVMGSLAEAVGPQAAAQTTPARTQQGESMSVATTEQGKVRGVSADGIHTFKGIPYGGSTAGSGRFRPPQPPAAWTGVREALTFAPMCPQVTSPLPPVFSSWTFDKDMSEDCLAPNVGTPGLNDGRKRPVMVWFHGGDFSNLSGSRNVFDGTSLAKKGDVVVITLNHRLNLFGYLYLAQLVPDLPDSGNVGLLDLIAALRWVRDNATAFGGDPGNITIFGQSGGGAKVTCLMAMPEAAGLFHRAIVQSGSYYLKAMDPEAGTKQARQLLAALDIQPGDARQLVSLPADALVAGLARVLKTSQAPNFRPVADGRALPAGPWAPDAPALSAGVPVMVGTVATEMTLLTGVRDPATFSLDEAGLRQRISAWFASGDVDRVISTFRAAHPNATPSELFFAIDTDRSMRQGAWRQAERRAAQQGAPVWLYEVDWATPVDGGKWKSPHSIELALVFDNVAKSASMVGTGPEPQRVADQMSACWLAFARSGNSDNAAVPNWSSYQPDRRATMVFDVQSKVVDDWRSNERKAVRPACVASGPRLHPGS